ncbi:hypothetical protein ASPACDRAFT_78596 [Aspergillus aculeatus ATCC 16872]|uniref:MARVEL domain-containing protein n=1 Tax=Aspergillus aculeatus (strain ATCC 16872 / CBS 172.66 / WB 5094) TaxID=690307 RepID=A0A1L9WTW3_ASPA1|nr:uncharacterized protein ASPACDRAFT_78596 [Aspergillus aculeatus ATCC 16872]OJJ99666.1 hypothetical protein ASPACDRAFT_78596 [Aspergillus aculeatus ATCC 16872]
MWFLLLRLFKFGVKAHKTHKAKKNGTYDPSSSSGGFPMSASNKTGTTTTISATSNNIPPHLRRSKPKHYLNLFLHILQLAFGLTALALYAHHIHTIHDSSPTATAGAKWVYAIVTALLGCGTAIAYIVLMQYILKTRVPVARRESWQLPMFVWEAVLCVVWLTLFGIFGTEYLGKKSATESGETRRMRHAVWVDLVNLGLWVGSAGWTGVRWWGNQRRPTGEGEGEGLEKGVEGEMV